MTLTPVVRRTVASKLATRTSHYNISKGHKRIGEATFRVLQNGPTSTSVCLSDALAMALRWSLITELSLSQLRLNPTAWV